MWHACVRLFFPGPLFLTRDLRSELSLEGRRFAMFTLPKERERPLERSPLSRIASVARFAERENEGVIPTSPRNEDPSCRLAADHKRNDKSPSDRHLNPYRANNIMSKGNCFTSYSVMIVLVRARHHLTTVAIKLSRRNAYLRAGRCLPDYCSLYLSLNGHGLLR